MGNGKNFMKLFIKPSYFRQDIKRREYIIAVLQSLFIMWVLCFLYYDSLWALLAFIPLGIWYFLQWEKDCIKRKRQEFQRQFQEAVRSLSAALSTGYSMENAMKEVKKDLSVLYDNNQPIQREFDYMLRQVRLRVPMEQIMSEWAMRVEQEDVSDFAAVFITAKRSGGNMIEIIRNAIRQIDDKLEVGEEIETLLAAKKYEFRVMSVVPCGIIAYMKLSFPEFMDILYGNLLGIGVMSGCLLVYIGAYALGQKIINIEV